MISGQGFKLAYRNPVINIKLFEPDDDIRAEFDSRVDRCCCSRLGADGPDSNLDLVPGHEFGLDCSTTDRCLGPYFSKTVNFLT